MKKINKNNYCFSKKGKIDPTYVLAIGTTTFSLVACGAMIVYELNPNNKNYDPNGVGAYVGTNTADLAPDSSYNLYEGVTQIKPIEGEDFNLVIKYSTNDNTWYATEDDLLAYTINTEGLSENQEVYVNNIHSDTYKISSHFYIINTTHDDYPNFQTWDSNINSQNNYGYKIDDESSYIGINTIGALDCTEKGQINDGDERGDYIKSYIDLIIVDTNTNTNKIVRVDSSVFVNYSSTKRKVNFDGEKLTAWTEEDYNNIIYVPDDNKKLTYTRK